MVHVLQTRKCTKSHNVRAQPLYYSLILLFSDVPVAVSSLKTLVNEDTLLRTHCCPWCFLGCANWETFVADTKCFWTKSETSFVDIPDTKSVSATNVARAGKRETFVSATMCPQQCVLVCQGLHVAWIHLARKLWWIKSRAKTSPLRIHSRSRLSIGDWYRPREFPFWSFLSRLTAFRLGAESISTMLEKTLVHVTLTTIPHWLRYARAPTNCLDLPHTSWRGPTRRFEICSTVRYRPTSPDLVADLTEFTAH